MNKEVLYPLAMIANEQYYFYYFNLMNLSVLLSVYNKENPNYLVKSLDSIFLKLSLLLRLF